MTITMKQTRRRRPQSETSSAFGLGGTCQPTDKGCGKRRPTRASFWDISLDEDWAAELERRNLTPYEVKSETRSTAFQAKRRIRDLRNASRRRSLTPDLAKKLEGDNEKILRTLLEGLRLIGFDGIGGSVSANYGAGGP